MYFSCLFNFSHFQPSGIKTLSSTHVYVTCSLTNIIIFTALSYILHIDTAVAFSHFTYEVTSRYLIVVDLQGVVGSDSWTEHKTIVLTDTAIHCPADVTRFGKTNFGQRGVDAFMSVHRCGPLCRKLGLDQEKPVLEMNIPTDSPEVTEKFDPCGIQ